MKRMSRPKLSILVPAIPGRFDRLKAILSRVTLSNFLYGQKYPETKLDPNKDIEFVIVDGGSTDNTRELCEAVGKHYRMKYIYLPIGKFINAGYPRNVGLRVCEGEVIGHLDIDHYPSQNIVEGMLRPFLDGRIDRHINRGYVVDTTKSPQGKGPNVSWLEAVNDHLLNDVNLRATIESVYEQTQIKPPGKNNTLWIWAAKRCYIDELNGYDELYCRQFAYSREDDDWRERMLANRMPFWDGAHKLFCAIHLWHEAAWRSNPNNKLNQNLFIQTCCPVREKVRNKGWLWGRMPKDAFSVMDGKYREPLDHERWVAQNRPEVPAYPDSPYWEDFDDYQNKLEEYVS